MPSNDKARRHKHAVKLTEINEKLAQIKAVPLHTKESANTIKHFSLGQHRMLFKRKQSPVPHQYQTAYDKGEFTRFPSDPATTLIIKGDDGGIIPCRSSLQDPSILKSIAILFNNLPPYEATPANRSGTSRGRHPYRHYCVWSPYSKRPFLSKEFKRHQSWQSVGPADLPGPDPTGISCSGSVSVVASYKPTREPVGSVYLN